jgi:hypothetical protein
MRMKTTNHAPVENRSRKPAIGYQKGRKILKAKVPMTVHATVADMLRDEKLNVY